MTVSEITASQKALYYKIMAKSANNYYSTQNSLYNTSDDISPYLNYSYGSGSSLFSNSMMNIIFMFFMQLFSQMYNTQTQ